MPRKKLITILAIMAIAIIIIINEKDKYLSLPKSDNLSRIIFIDVINNKGVNKTSISQEEDINKILEILAKSEKTPIESVSQYPNKREFTSIIFEFKSEGKSFRSVYEENGEVHINQPFEGVYKLDREDYLLLYDFIKSGIQEDILIPLEDIENIRSFALLRMTKTSQILH